MRPAGALVLLALLLGCGSTAPAGGRAGPVTVDLDWHDRYVADEERFDFSVRRLVVDGHGWRAEASFTNRTGATFVIDWPHHPGPTMCGLVYARPLLHHPTSPSRPGLGPAADHERELPAAVGAGSFRACQRTL